ncbi:MAG: PTPA-CTERM sorting domain-containing protein [Drouetiella hepatica Uher 2000/2452]|jgi:hypothetical protein|uniref:PTPA-CTERM sorting domain-containing protein n=1 Tax=Drouetiella hepatica Uher 2000/2452 TaxID=904376 RepID=A0A951QDR2_9CYAN|nr:PTPA-CTERM sorting domain-containing protein [Drouetiella hepatica Uher 2000/2452]
MSLKNHALLGLLTTATLTAAFPATAATVDFRNQGNLTTPQFSQNGLTVTGSNTLNITSGGFFSGLGVVGNTNQAIDLGESALFQFSPDGASNVSLFSSFIFVSGGTSNASFNFEGFAPGGNSLGVVSLSLSGFFPAIQPSGLDVSGLFSNSTLSAFRFTSDGAPSPTTGANISQLSFNPIAPPTPIPTPALLPGLLGMGIAAWHKRRKQRTEFLSN